ncbi:hypothetical protein [Pedobacter gandavensis]|uniref:Lipoprotein n=1 Tax=Pedobacter gandavensis TaxID=2679963 RepID=A0ABR6EUR8_9SPHI|nr:hypothetical protein [Pedobacter gandavensis]MBB2148797.1 hypothetical protein [Pedobacter gandavensis]
MKKLLVIIALSLSVGTCKKDCPEPESKKERIKRPDPRDRPVVDTTVKPPKPI